MLGLLTVVLAAPQRDVTPLGDWRQHLFSPAIAALSSSVEPVDAEQLVPLLDEACIWQAVVFSVAYQYSNPNRPPVENEYEKVKAENDWRSAQVARFPDRLRAFCSVNPLKDYALEEIKRCAKEGQASTRRHGDTEVELVVFRASASSTPP